MWDVIYLPEDVYSKVPKRRQPSVRLHEMWDVIYLPEHVYSKVSRNVASRLSDYTKCGT